MAAVKVCAHCQHVRITKNSRITDPPVTYECAIGERLATHPITGRQSMLRQWCNEKNRLGDCTDYLERFERGRAKTLLQRLLAWWS